MDSLRSMTTTIAFHRRGRHVRHRHAASTHRSTRADLDCHSHRNRRPSRWLRFDGGHANAGDRTCRVRRRRAAHYLDVKSGRTRPRTKMAQFVSSAPIASTARQISCDNSDTSQCPPVSAAMARVAIDRGESRRSQPERSRHQRAANGCAGLRATARAAASTAGLSRGDTLPNRRGSLRRPTSAKRRRHGRRGSNKSRAAARRTQRHRCRPPAPDERRRRSESSVAPLQRSDAFLILPTSR